MKTLSIFTIAFALLVFNTKAADVTVGNIPTTNTVSLSDKVIISHVAGGTTNTWTATVGSLMANVTNNYVVKQTGAISYTPTTSYARILWGSTNADFTLIQGTWKIDFVTSWNDASSSAGDIIQSCVSNITTGILYSAYPTTYTTEVASASEYQTWASSVMMTCSGTENLTMTARNLGGAHGTFTGVQVIAVRVGN